MGKNFKDWIHVERIERTNETTITIIGIKLNTTYEFKTPQECLKKFLELRKEFEGAWKFPAPKRYRNGAKW